MIGRWRTFGAILAVITVAADQASKTAILGLDLDTHQLAILPVFNLVLVWNHGVSFGMFNHGAPLPPILFAAFSSVIGLGFAVWLARAETKLLAVALGLVVGGAFGNVIDRLTRGAVVDFLDVHLGAWHWPSFNVADSAVVAGIALILLDGLFFGRKDRME